MDIKEFAKKLNNSLEKIDQYINTINDEMEGIKELIATKNGRLIQMKIELDRLENIKAILIDTQQDPEKKVQSNEDAAELNKIVTGLKICAEKERTECNGCPYYESDCNDLTLDVLKYINKGR